MASTMDTGTGWEWVYHAVLDFAGGVAIFCFGVLVKHVHQKGQDDRLEIKTALRNEHFDSLVLEAMKLTDYGRQEVYNKGRIEALERMHQETKADMCEGFRQITCRYEELTRKMEESQVSTRQVVHNLRNEVHAAVIKKQAAE